MVGTLELLTCPLVDNMGLRGSSGVVGVLELRTCPFVDDGISFPQLTEVVIASLKQIEGSDKMDF